MPHDAEIHHDGPAVGHNSSGEEVVWERWTKKQTYVRALEGTYGELVATYGEEATARYADGLAERIRRGEFTVAPNRQ